MLQDSPPAQEPDSEEDSRRRRNSKSQKVANEATAASMGPMASRAIGQDQVRASLRHRAPDSVWRPRGESATSRRLAAGNNGWMSRNHST
jgi:hypothetical protein